MAIMELREKAKVILREAMAKMEGGLAGFLDCRKPRVCRET
jgi:hypothetical protein